MGRDLSNSQRKGAIPSKAWNGLLDRLSMATANRKGIPLVRPSGGAEPDRDWGGSKVRLHCRASNGTRILRSKQICSVQNGGRKALSRKPSFEWVGWQSLDRAIDVPVSQDVLVRGWDGRDYAERFVRFLSLDEYCPCVTGVRAVEGCGLLADG